MVLVRVGARLLFLDCQFDEDLDDYPDRFEIYELPPDHHGFGEGDWTTVLVDAQFLGRLPLAAVEFDATRRKAMTARSLGDVLAGDITGHCLIRAT
jgi:hypothetical protein